MPQNALQATVSVNPAGQQAPQVIDAYSNVNVVPNPAKTLLNITTATVVKGSAGLIGRVWVNTAGSTAGTLSDCATTGAVAAANLIATLPNTVGPYAIEFYAAVGIVVTPGTGQVVSISFD